MEAPTIGAKRRTTMEWKTTGRLLYYVVLNILTGGVAFFIWLHKERKVAAEEEKKYLLNRSESGRY